MRGNRAVAIALCALTFFAAACAQHAEPAAMPETTPAQAPEVVTFMDAEQPTVAPAEIMPTPTPTPEPTPVPEPFTIVLFPDTQNSVYKEPEAMRARGKWVHDHIESDHIVLVAHVGDLVNNGLKDPEWISFELAYDQFKDDVPFFCVAGNHDLGQGVGSWKGYLKQPCVQAIPDGQQYKDGMAAYLLFEAGGLKWIILGAGYGAELESVDWLNEQLDAYPDREAILVFHRFLSPDVGLTAIAQRIMEEVAAPHDNVCMALCGHFRGTGYERTILTNPETGKTHAVHTILFNYQNYSVGTAHMRTLLFDPLAHTVTVTTINPMSDKDEWPDEHFGTTRFVIEGAF